MLNGHRRSMGAVGLAAAALFIAACGSSSSTSTASKAPAPASSRPQSTASSPTTVRLAKGSAGTYLVGPSGHALYLWVADPKGRSMCEGQCAQAWPPLVVTSTPKGASGVTASELGVIKRSGSGEQVTYAGHPLYYFAGDSGAGTTTGQGNNGFGAKWWLVAPSGSAITASAPSAGSSSSGGGYGGGGSTY